MRITNDTTGNAVDSHALGPTIALHLSDHDATARWRLTVVSFGPSGPARVGVFDTATATLGSGLSRIVGWAHVPGAHRWRISWALLAGSPTAVADLEVWATSAAAPNVGMLPNGGFATVVP